MILLSSPLKNDPLETTVSIFFFLEIEIVTTNIVSSKNLKKICRQLLSTMNVLKQKQNKNYVWETIQSSAMIQITGDWMKNRLL